MAALPHDYERFLFAKDSFGLYDDFFHFVSGDDFTDTSADAGAAWTAGDAVGGRVSGVTGAVDNNEAYLHTTQELFLVADNKALRFAVRLQFTEANTDDANVMFGFMSALAANSLVDDGAGVRTSGSLAVIYKIDGGTVWRCANRDNDGAEDTVSTTTAGGTSFQTLRIEILDNGTLPATVVYYVDDVALVDANGIVIKHQFTLTSSTEMNLGLYVKAGGANSEVVLCDYMGGWQLR